MDLRRLRPAEWVLTAAAAALVVSLFLPWYGLGRAGTTFTGWRSFAAVDVILLACAAVALLAVLLQATQRTPALPVVSSVAAVWTGLVAVVIVALTSSTVLTGSPTPATAPGSAWPPRLSSWAALGGRCATNERVCASSART